MAIRLEGTLNTVAGATTGSYIRLEYVKYMPWVGSIEYTPMCFKNELEADMSRIRYFGDELPAATFPIPHMSMNLLYVTLSTYKFVICLGWYFFHRHTEAIKSVMFNLL